MTHLFRNRSRLLVSCGGGALALALVMTATERAEAQAFQANPTEVVGTIDRIITGPGTEIIVVRDPVVVVDWQPEIDNFGNALDFLPTGHEATFTNESDGNAGQSFAILNRILPSPNGNIAVFDGTVISRIIFEDPNNGGSFTTPGGFVAFYSPTGILVGSNAIFDVGQLLLTSLEPDPSSFADFVGGGNLSLFGAPGSTARVQIEPGAQILATPENAFFAVVAADVQMRGSALVNGSHAYVAGEVVNLSLSNGLFDISVPVGTAASGRVVTVDGTVGGPSSNGAGDNHVIYGVAHAAADPISMLFRGNLGFDPAQAASIVNGEIILAANYNVVGRVVNGGEISQGIAARFNRNSAQSDVRADIFIDDFTASSSLLAITTHRVQATAVNTASSVAGDLLLVGRENAELAASNGQNFTISGDLLVDARDYGVVGPNVPTLDALNAQGGFAIVNALENATITVGGDALVTADAFGGVDEINRIAGSSQAGTALVGGVGGTVNVTGSATVTASGFGNGVFDVLQGAQSRGGLAQFYASQGGTASVGQNLTVLAKAQGAFGSLLSPSTVSNAVAGQAVVGVFNDGGTVEVDGLALVSANAFGGTSNNAGAGSIGNAGQALITFGGSGLVQFAQSVLLEARGVGGNNPGGTGGVGRGGRAGTTTSGGGTILVADVFNADAQGLGGSGRNGGNARGGIAANGGDGLSLTINGDLFLNASASGGSPVDGTGGNGTGGEAFLILGANGAPGSITVAGHASILADGVGGTTTTGFPAGDGTGGLSFVDALGGSVITLGSAQVTAIGLGGIAQSNAGGDGTGGIVRLRANGTGSRLRIQRNVPTDFSETVGGAALLSADGIGEAAFGGDGIGGAGTGGTLEIFATQGGTIGLPTDVANDPDSASPQLLITATGTGGGSAVAGGTGGTGAGGNALIEIVGAGSALVMGDTVFSASGVGGSSLQEGPNVTGGDAFGGVRRIRVLDGGELTAQLSGLSGGRGGDGSGSGNGGTATGGRNQLELNNGTINITGQIALTDGSRGGNGATGGDAFGDGAVGGIFFTAIDSTINFTPNAGGGAGIVVGGSTFGGEGVAQGGAATSATVTFDLENTDINGGGFQIGLAAIGGAALGTAGIGGNATSQAMTVNIANSTIDLDDQTIIASDAIGGAGSVGGQGGSAISGAVAVNIRNSTLTAQPGTLRVQSRASGGDGGTIGNAASGSAALTLDNSVLVADQVQVFAQAFANGAAGQTGGNAQGGQALFALSGASTVDAGVIELVGSGVTSLGGTSAGGTASLQMSSGSTAEINADTLRLIADGSGADPANLANAAGQFFVSIGGGNANIGSLTATGLGDAINAGAPASQLSAVGGNLNVADQLLAAALGDIAIQTGQGGIIGGPLPLGATTVITINTSGEIAITGEIDSPGGIGGQSISLNAGRSILLGGNVAANNGPVALVANNGTALPLPAGQTETAAIIMAEGSSINAGSGTASIDLLNGGGVPGTATGAITLASITAGQIDVRNSGTSPGSDIVVRDTGVLTASASGQAIDLASLSGEVLNLAGDPGLVLTGGGYFGIFAATPTGSQIGSFNTYQRRYSIANEGTYDALDLGGNFAAFRIVPVLTVTVDDVSRSYGSNNPVFTAAYQGFLPGDSSADLLGAPFLTTTADALSSLGLYTINVAPGSLVSPQGYQLAVNPGRLTVVPRPITVTADNLNRLYGNANPALTFTVGGEGLVNGDQLAGALATAAGATTGVGTVAITQGTLAATANYALTFVNGQLTITPRPLAITADNLSRIYGNANPALTFSVSEGGLVNGDQLTGALATTAGVATGVGNVAITQGSLTGGPNYAVSFVNGQLTITPRPITVTADNLSRIYGNANPALTFSLGEGALVNGDQLTGALATAAGATTGVGTAAITQGTLAATANYTLTFVNGQLTITPRAITVTANDLSRIYGNANPALTFSVGEGALVNGDQLTGALATAAGATTGVGTVAITQGTLAATANYALTFVNGQLTITPRPITVTANDLSRIYGNANPALTFTVGEGGLVNGDQLTGALATAAGATTGVGTTPITQGTLTGGPNYAVTFVNGQLTITPRPITVTADDLAKLFGQPDPALTFTIGGDGLVNEDTVSGALAREPGEQPGAYAINRGTLDAGRNYSVTFNGGELTIDPPPAPPVINNPTLFERPLRTDTDPSRFAGEQDERFGIDFPESAEAGLITEDEWLDEPVTSGGDASLHGGGTTPPEGAK